MADIASNINWVDFVILIFLIRACYIGASVGFGQELFGSIGALVALVVSIHYYDLLGRMVSSTLPIPSLLASAACFALLATVIIILFKIAGALLGTLVKVEFHSVLGKIGGIIFGVVRGFLWLTIILLFFFMLPNYYLENSIANRSLTGGYILASGPLIHDLAMGLFDKDRADGKQKDVITRILDSKKAFARANLRSIHKKREVPTY